MSMAGVNGGSLPSNTSSDDGQDGFLDFEPAIRYLLCDLKMSGFAIGKLQHGVGWNNCVYTLSSTTNPHEQYILRVPAYHKFRQSDGADESTLRDVALLGYLAHRLSVPVPRVKAYSSGADNTLGAPFMIQTRIPGVSLDNLYRTFSHKEKLDIADQMVDLLGQIESVTFATTDPLEACPDFPLKANNIGTIEAGAKTSVTTETSLLSRVFSSLSDMNGTSVTTQSFAEIDIKPSLVDQLRVCIESELRYNERLCQEAPSDLSFQKLMDIVEDMDKEGTFDGSPCPIVLDHGDLQPRNIMVHFNNGKWKISGVIDWDSASALPRPFVRIPPSWIWNHINGHPIPDEDSNDSWRARTNRDNMALKEHFNKRAAMTLDGYLEDAYGSGYWLRKIWSIAQKGDYQRFYSTHLEKLAEDWQNRWN